MEVQRDAQTRERSVGREVTTHKHTRRCDVSEKAVSEERVTAVIVDGMQVGYTIAVTQEEMEAIFAALFITEAAYGESEIGASLVKELKKYAP